MPDSDIEKEALKLETINDEYKPLAKVEELEEQNYNMIDNVLNNGAGEKENKENMLKKSLKQRLEEKKEIVAENKKKAAEQKQEKSENEKDKSDRKDRVMNEFEN